MFLVKYLPEPNSITGRPAYSNLELLPGILLILRSGGRWKDLDYKSNVQASGVTHWRRFRFWGSSFLWSIFYSILKRLAKSRLLDLSLAKLDGSLIPSFNFREGVGYSGKHKRLGTKISALVDASGLPVGMITSKGNVHDVKLAIPTLDKTQQAKLRPKLLQADKGYDSTEFRRELRKRHIKANIPERIFKKRRRKGRPPKYDSALGKKRYVVERTNAWLKSFRRLHFRFDYTLKSFETWVILACLVIVVRRLIS